MIHVSFLGVVNILDSLNSRPSQSAPSKEPNTIQMTNTMGGAHLCTSQSNIFQQMISPQSAQQPQHVEPWMQTLQMPCPTISIPWSVASSSQQSELITFTGRPNYKPVFHHKRKLETAEFGDMGHQAKQFITEEKMAAHFKDLHISSNYETENPVPSTSAGHTSSFSHKQGNMDLDVDAVTSEQTDELHPRLIISEEVKRMQQEPILPSTILSKLERPSMALVLWEPPNKHLLRILPSRDTPTPIPSTSHDSNSNNNNNNNNNDTIPDLNNVSPSAPSAFEPMEL